MQPGTRKKDHGTCLGETFTLNILPNSLGKLACQAMKASLMCTRLLQGHGLAYHIKLLEFISSQRAPVFHRLSVSMVFPKTTIHSCLPQG